MNLDWAWISRNAGLILSLLGQHIVLSVVPVLIAFVVSLPLG
jgi:osmoprotectant transport system permease protein